MSALTGREYPPEVVWNAQELYCVARLSYAELAAETGVGINTLKRWGQKFEWADKRGRIAQAEADLRADTILARSAMLKKLIESKDAQTGFAVASLETLAMRQAEAARAQKILTASEQRELREIHTQDDAVAALEEAVALKLQCLLASPEDVDLKAVKNIKEAMALVAEMKPKEDLPDRQKGMSADFESTLRELLRK